jgi:hypothetical protein
MADATQGVLDDLPLDRQLTFVPNVRQHAASAFEIGNIRRSIARRVNDATGHGPADAALDALDLDLDGLPWNRSGDEHDSTLMARDHASAGSGPFDHECQSIAFVHGVKAGL